MKKFLSIVAILSLVFSIPTPAFAADSSWNLDAAGPSAWTVGGSWTAGAPGAVSPGLVSTDRATFSLAQTLPAAITVDADRNIKFIDFGSTDADGYTLQTGALVLTNGGIIQSLAASVGHTDTVASAIALQGVGGTANFTADATVATGLLVISGGVTGVSTAGTTTTLTIDGINTGNNTISGVIGDGAAGGNLAIVKAEAGTWVLANTNTYSGGTTIREGTISGTTNGAAFGTGTITIGHSSGAANATLSGGLAGTFANLISVASGNTGTATITSSAASIFSGAVTLNTHALTLTGGASTLTLSGGITGTGNLTLNSTGIGVITLSTASVNNTGTITNSGASTGDNVISGGVGANVTGITQNSAGSALTINTTALTVNAAGTTLTNTAGGSALTVASAVAGTGNLTINNDSALDAGVTLAAVNNIGTVTNSGSGAGTATITGVIGTNVTGLTQNSATSTFTLSGANTYTGATAVNAGTLKAGVASVANTSGAFGNNSAVTMANVATAILDITGFNTQIGSLTGGGTTGGNVTLGAATLTVGGTTSPAAYSGVISGAGGAVTKTGTGTLTFGNNNTYTGATTITTGTLAYSTSVSSASAHTNNATLSLGTSTLTITGANAYTQGAASTLNVSITNATTFGNIVATGANAVINAGSTVNVTVGTQYIAGGTAFKIVDGNAAGAPSVPGTITDNSYVLSFTGAVTTGDLTLTAVRTNSYNTAVTGGNNQAAGSALEQAGKNGATGDMAVVLNTLDSMSSGAAINTAIETMTPDVSAGTAEGSRVLTGNSFTMISNRLGGARNGGAMSSGVSSGDMTNGLGVWIQGLGSNMKQKERKGIEGFSANTWGTTIGVDKVLDNHFRAGLAGGYGWAGVHSKQPGSPSDDINSFQGTIYGSYDSLDLNKARQGGKKSYEAVRSQVEDSWYMDGMFAFTQNNYDSRREIWLTSTTKRVAKADHYAQQYSTNFEAGYKFVFEETKKLEVTPFASLGYNYLYMNSYKEDGANALNLSVQGEGFHQLEQALGTKLAYPIVAEKVGTFIPSAKAAWLYDYIGDRFETTASFAGGGGSFNTKGAKPAKNGMLFGAELAFLNKGNVTMTGNWDIELKDQFMSNTYYGTVRYDF